MNKFALVTGSSDRIGKAIALELAKQGYNLLLHYNNSQQKAEQVKIEVENFQVKVQLLHINFLEENNFDDILQNLKNENIQLEVLVNCASDFRPSGYSDKGSELLQKELRINFEKAYLLTKAFANNFESGLIVNFLDTKVEKNFTKHLDYILSKKLLKEFTKLSAVHLAPNFRVNAIAPGLILPPKDKDESYLLNLAKNIPLKTIGNLEEILKAFRFLLESKFVTGQILYIDGGEHLI
ncbi:MAG: SDR family oxidoreductase [Chitinophagales bacterium]|nr:SDR family oxidoreductase [Chitinophagales bacterium]